MQIFAVTVKFVKYLFAFPSSWEKPIIEAVVRTISKVVDSNKL